MNNNNLLKNRLKNSSSEEETKPSSEFLQNIGQFNNDFDTEVLKADMEKEKVEEDKRNLNKTISLIAQIAMVIFSIYLVMNLFGLLNYRNVYDAQGNLVPEIITVEKIQKLEAYKTMKAEYLEVRKLYEFVLRTDYRLGAGLEEPIIVAQDYENALKSISQISASFGNIVVSTEYAQLMNMLESWVRNDIAIYCQNISTAISRNSNKHAKQALQYREISYNNFKTITQVFVTLALQNENIDVSDIANWSPEGYVETFKGGL